MVSRLTTSATFHLDEVEIDLVAVPEQHIAERSAVRSRDLTRHDVASDASGRPPQ